MDGGENIVDTLVQNFSFLRDALFSEQTLHLLNTHLLSPSSPLQTLRRQLLDISHTLLALMAPILNPLLDRLTQALYNSPDIVVLLVFVVFLFLVLQVLAWIRRVMVWLTGLLMRVVFWSCVVAGLAVLWQRGAEQTARDVVVLGAKIAGWGAAIRDIWWKEYRRYEAQQQHAVRR